MGRTVALVSGNSEYDDASLARLITPSEDMNDLAALLKSPDILTFLHYWRVDATEPA